MTKMRSKTMRRMAALLLAAELLCTAASAELFANEPEDSGALIVLDDPEEAEGPIVALEMPEVTAPAEDASAETASAETWEEVGGVLKVTTSDGSWPQLNVLGFLDKGEFVYWGDEEGVWRYCSPTLKV